MMDADIIIIGAGVVGCAVARELSRYQANILVLEKGADVAEGASRANSGIIHAGFDAVPGSVKARMNVQGAALYPSWCSELGVPCAFPGALVLGFGQQDQLTLQKLYDQGVKSGVPGLRLLSAQEVLELEPAVNPGVSGALLAETSGLVSPYEMTYALADHAAVNGVRFQRNTRVIRLERGGTGWSVMTDRGTLTCGTVINCAGTASAGLHNMISPRPLHIVCRRGQYYLTDHLKPMPFTRTMFQCPTGMGKGVLVSPTVHGNLLLGPSAEDIPDAGDTSTTREGLDGVLQACRLTWPQVSLRSLVTNFAGVRAHEEGGDFVIGRTEGAVNAYEAVGIESPGLSAAPAIAVYLADMISGDLRLNRKEEFLPPLPIKPFFRDMTVEQKIHAVAEDPMEGNIVCRCEVVT